MQPERDEREQRRGTAAPRPGRLRPPPAGPAMAGRRPARAQLRHQLRGGLGARRSPTAMADDEVTLTEVASPIVPRGTRRPRPPASMFEYGSRVGFWRLYRIFTERDLQPTDLRLRLALERNPEAAAAIREARLRLLLPRLALGRALPPDRRRGDAPHPPRHRLARDDRRRAPAGLVLPLRPERQHAPPAGSRKAASSTTSTPTTTSCPIGAGIGERRPHLVVPYSLTNNDGQFARGGFRHRRRLLRSSCATPSTCSMRRARWRRKMMSVGLHCRADRPSGARRGPGPLPRLRRRASTTSGSRAASTSRSTGTRTIP